MKRIVCILLVCLTVFCLFSCEEKDANAAVYQELNSLAAKNRYAFVLDVKTQLADETLNAHFSVANSDDLVQVRYEVEERAVFGEDPANDPESAVVTKVGIAKLQDGKITLDGDPVDADFSAVSVLGVKFDGAYFADVTVEDGSLSAKVTDPKAFLNLTDFAGEDVRITVKWSGTLESLTLSYKQGEATVTVTYSFD